MKLILMEKPAEISLRENEPILEEEPDINLGVAGALKLATKKGYLYEKLISSAARSSQLQAQSYTIEEKFYEDDKFCKRDRCTGPVQEFKEKSYYKPDVKLDYIDDSGRLLTAKETFHYLSHKFHGKGPGNNKIDKRMKKLKQDTEPINFSFDHPSTSAAAAPEVEDHHQPDDAEKMGAKNVPGEPAGGDNPEEQRHHHAAHQQINFYSTVTVNIDIHLTEEI